MMTTAPAEGRPFVVPCAKLRLDAPRRWLRLGWQDFKRAPALSLLFGIVIMLLSIAISVFAYSLGRFALLAMLLSGFVFIAPLIAVGLYCVSRELGAGREPSLRDSFTLARRVLGQAGIFALALLVILLLWSRAGMMVSAFFPVQEGEWASLVDFLALGSLFGAIFAALTFATAAFSLPMIADRDVDMITACVSSINAVLRNKTVMLLWAALIVLLTAIGFATAFLGLVVIMPWLAYAAWHGYRETLDASAWPPLE
ncbi:MAG: DUF2189 domain-containing protein [Steroidobacteraceae bacterium]